MGLEGILSDMSSAGLRVKKVLLILSLGTLTLSGCITVSGGYSEAEPTYYVHAEVVTQTPTNATAIPVTDDRIDGIELIQRGITEATQTNESHLTVTETEYHRVTHSLSKTPLYTTESDRWVNATGLYVRVNGQIVRIMVYTQTPV